jgi:hypothetical protein
MFDCFSYMLYGVVEYDYGHYISHIRRFNSVRIYTMIYKKKKKKNIKTQINSMNTDINIYSRRIKKMLYIINKIYTYKGFISIIILIFN